jgi:membrane associated rhomboid family serine protease
MSFAPVGIRCPDHATVQRARPTPTQTVRRARRQVLGHEAPATLALIAINVVVYLITVSQGGGLSRPGGSLFEHSWLTGVQVANGDWWRLVTPMFLHASILHLAFNMFALWALGRIVEQALGTWRFLLVYFASGLAGSAGALLLSSSFAVTVGASGAIFGIMGSLLILEWRQTGSFAGQALTLILLNLALTFAIPNISIGGHLGGLIGGILATLALAEAPRRRLPAATGPAVVVLIGMLSVILALVVAKNQL